MHTWLAPDYCGRVELEIKRSRFIATLARADDEDAARAVIAGVRHEFPDARHHCTAFVVDVPGANAIERSSDDGEPSGTAGVPMLGVLRGADVSMVVAVVTRYFGGVLLGTGGLVRAYSDAVGAALDEARFVRPVEVPRYRVASDYASLGRLTDDLVGAGCVIESTDYAADPTLTVCAASELGLEALVARVSGGTARVERAGTTIREEPVTPGDQVY